MDTNDKESLIEAYFDALDEPDYDAVESVFTDDFVYLFPDEGRIEGLDETVSFFKNDKPTENTDHDVFRYLHDGAVSVSEGTVTGERGDARFSGEFCDVFEFDEDEERIAKIAVYSRVQEE